MSVKRTAQAGATCATNLQLAPSSFQAPDGDEIKQLVEPESPASFRILSRCRRLADHKDPINMKLGIKAPFDPGKGE